MAVCEEALVLSRISRRNSRISIFTNFVDHLTSIESEDANFRNQVEKLRQTAGESWLTFYNELQSDLDDTVHEEVYISRVLSLDVFYEFLLPAGKGSPNFLRLVAKFTKHYPNLHGAAQF